MIPLSDWHRRTLNILCIALARRFLLHASLLFGILLTAGTTHHTGFVIGNATPSVPRGLYLRADPDHASYVTFCLGTRHWGIWTYPDLCSPGTPKNKKTLQAHFPARSRWRPYRRWRYAQRAGQPFSRPDPARGNPGLVDTTAH